ncbi:hypothetical protein, partial [Candidatus Soleaferrea massiliensis]|uniref:hypothetical protein n=1 Tax=Candidatus Soleaferrea massiliensis TaxID=1470354 RepID=UPI001A9A4F08
KNHLAMWSLLLCAAKEVTKKDRSRGPAALVHALRVTEIRKEPMTNTPQLCSRKDGIAERPTAGGGPLENPL